MIAQTKRTMARLSGSFRGDGLKARLIRGALGSAGIQAASRILALALGIILARGLGPDGYGIYAYAFAIMSLLMVAAEAGVPTLLMREVAAAEGRGDWGLMRGALRRSVQFVALASISIAGLGLIVLTLLSDRMQPASLYTMALMLLVLPVAALVKTVGHGLRGLHRVVTAQALEMLLRPALVIGLVGVVFVFWPDMRAPYTVMAAQLATVIVVVLVAAILLKQAVPPAADAALPEFRSRQWLRSALPFTLIGGALVINNQTDIVMLGWFTSAEEVGFYRVAAQAATLVFLPLQIFHAVSAPLFSMYYSQGDIRSIQMLDRRGRLAVIVISFFISVLMIAYSSKFLTIFFGSEFIYASLLLSIFVAGFFLNVTCGAVGTLMQMINQETFTARVLWGTSLLNIIGNFILIPMLGALGAAITTAATTFIYHLILRLCVRHRLGV